MVVFTAVLATIPKKKKQMFLGDELTTQMW